MMTFPIAAAAALSMVSPSAVSAAADPPHGVESPLPADSGLSLRLDDAPDGRARRFSFGRAAMELGLAMSAGVVWYETQIELNKQDFDFQRSWSGQWQRLVEGRGYRFDDNGPVLNVGHAFMGLYYHQLARTNNGTMLEALLFDLTTSSVWELAVEHREVFSLNDTVVTSVGGLTLGEPMFQMGDYFARSAPTWRNRLLMGIFSPTRAVLGLFEDGRLPRARALDAHGLADDGYHRFALGAGSTLAPLAPAAGAAAATADSNAATFSARLDMELINLRTYGREGRLARSLRGGEATRVTFDYAGTHQDLQALTLATRTSLFGRYSQDISAAGADRRGHSVLVAAGSAFDLSLNDRGPFTDLLTAVHLIGPTADASFYRGPFALRLAGDLYGDFAMLRPYALDPAAPAELLAGTKSVLARQHYYYALGVTAAARAEASFRRARAGAALEWNGYDSIEGLDRRQEDLTSPTGVYHAGITDDFDIVDQRMKLRLYGDLPTFVRDVYLGMSVDMQRRSGTMKEATRTDSEGRATVLLSYVM